MKTRIVILPYKMGSKSAKDLSAALREKGLSSLQVYHSRNYRKRPTDLVLNWGSSQPPSWGEPDINTRGSVYTAANKIHTLSHLSFAGVPTLEYTSDKTEASVWDKVYCRMLVNSCGGKGIVIWYKDSGAPIPEAPLYTKGEPISAEYRVHVWRDSVIDLTQKKQRNNTVCNQDIRNHNNGWVFCREGISYPTDLTVVAISAIKALGLNFGAVDIGVTSDNKVVVFEVNTAPDITGTTLKSYVEAIRNEFYSW